VNRCPSHFKASTATSCGRTRVDGDGYTAALRHFQQRRNRKFWRAHEYNSHSRQQHPMLDHQSLTMAQILSRREKFQFTPGA
jgi:hypothetical protein